jgi:tetratricopeptide (TPR) repeat protein
VQRCLFILIAVAAAAVLPAAQRTGAEPLNLRCAYERLRDAAYDGEPVEVVAGRYELAVEELRGAFIGPRERNLWASRLEYMMGRACRAWDQRGAAAGYFEKGLAYTQAAMADGEFSEGWRMMSEHVGQLCMVEDLGYLVANGRKVTEFAQRAVALDPRNVAARIILAAGKVYAPAMFGGNPRTGINMMEETLALGAREKDDLFNIYSGIAYAYAKIGRREEALNWWEKALVLYPNNQYANKEYRKLRT